MASTDWMIRGPEIASCNCNYGCPCQFNSLPSDGTCRAAAWPGAIHQGHGEILPIVDERASAEQREALLKIMSDGPIKLQTSGRHAHLAMLHLTGQGIVH